MNRDKIQSLAKELSVFINRLVNVPFINEEEEQFFFEIVLLKALQLVLGELEA